MDRKSIIVLVVSFVLMIAWYPLIVNKWLYPPKPLPPGSTNAITSTNIVAAPPASSTQAVSTPLAPPPSPPSLMAASLPEDAPEQLLELTNATSHYTLTSRGGGLKKIELVEYPETVTRRSKQTTGRRVATLNAFTPSPSMTVLAGDTLRHDGVYDLQRTPTGARAEKVLTNGLAIVKEFQLSTNYLLIAKVRIENRGSNAISLPPQEWIVGTATPMNREDSGMAVGAFWYDGNKKHEAGASYFSTTTMGCFPRTPPAEYRAGNSNVVWASVQNQFFALAAMPQVPAQSVVVQKVDLTRLTDDDDGPQDKTARPPAGYIAAMSYPAATLAPGTAQERTIHIFAGPKEYQTLARIGTRFQNNIDLVMGWGFFGWVTKPLLLTMNWLHNSLSLSYGWAIIVITVIIKLLFWPLTQASTRSMKRLAALQPQLKAIQEKYKDDPVKMNRKSMEFMREHKVSPLGGCLPMLLQIPVFFGFYSMIQSAIELRGASWFWVADLSKPDTLFYIPGTGFPFNLLPIIMGATMLWQARLTPPSPGMDPTQAKIMRYMPVIFMVFLYNFSAGLTLYWTVQNLLTIAQTKLTKTKEEPVTPVKGPVLTPTHKKRK